MIRPSQAAILARMRYDLEHKVQPELQSDFVRALVGQMSELLRLLSVDDDAMAKVEAAFGSAVAAAGVTGVADSVRALTEHGEAQVVATSADAGAAAQDNARALIAAESDFILAHRAAAQAQAERDDSRFGDLAPVTVAAVQAYFARRHPECPALEVTAVTQVAGGWTKDTFIVDIANWSGPARIVIRKDVPASTTEARVADEARIFQKLESAGFPAPRALWLEPSAEPLGQPFLVIEFLPGKAALAPAWRDDADICRSASLDFARLLARLHSIPLAALGYDVSQHRDPVGVVHEMVDYWHDLWRRHRHVPSPTLARAFAWLKANVPQGSDRIAFVHGDAGWHNVLVEDGAITGLLDWEFAHPGDPSEDISYVKRFIEPMLPWQDFIDAYVAAGGAPERADTASWYEVWRSVRNAVCCCMGQTAFISGVNPQFKFTVVGVQLYRKFILDIADNLKRVGA